MSLVRAAGGPPKERTVVVVDAGHGGFDHGAIGLHGTREADIALEIARRTAAALKARLGIDVILTRDGDYFVTLQERAAIANRNDADLFLSIHANAAPGPTAWGIETYSLDTASDAGAARVARRENAIVRESEGETDPLLSKMLVTGTNMLSRQLAGEVQASTVKSLQGMYGPSAIRNLGRQDGALLRARVDAHARDPLRVPLPHERGRRGARAHARLPERDRRRDRRRRR